MLFGWLYQVCIHTHTHTRSGNDITGFTALDSLITTLNEQLIKAGFLGSVPAPPRRSSLSCSLLSALKAEIPESIAKRRQVKPCGDREKVRRRDLARKKKPLGIILTLVYLRGGMNFIGCLAI